MSSEMFTVCFWAGYEGNRSTFRPWVKLQGGGLIREQFPPNTTPARRESQRRYVETELQSGRFTRELRLFNV